MKKRDIILLILVLGVITLSIFIAIFYFENNKLKVENARLEWEKAEISREKEVVINEKEICREEVVSLKADLDLLEEDVSKIYMGCISNNKCNGHYPGIRWYCNIDGDAVSNASNICSCDESCKLVITSI